MTAPHSASSLVKSVFILALIINAFVDYSLRACNCTILLRTHRLRFEMIHLSIKGGRAECESLSSLEVIICPRIAVLCTLITG